MSDPDVVLPWPERALWPNDRSNRWQKAAATRRARATAFYLMRESGLRFPEVVHLQFTFRPPSRRGYNDDNALAACKALRDGMADASGVEDQHWRTSHAMGTIKRPRGCVEIRRLT